MGEQSSGQVVQTKSASTSKNESVDLNTLGEVAKHSIPFQASHHEPLIHTTISKEAAIATHSALQAHDLSQEDEKRIRGMYDRLDIDNDGTIDIRDLTLALKHDVPHIPTQLAPQIMARIGTGEDDRIHFSDFANYVLEHEERLAAMFRDIDTHNNGYVDAIEIQNYCSDLGMPLDEKKAMTIVNIMDPSQHATVTLNKFKEFMLLFPSSDLREIVNFWRYTLAIDIGEMQSPADFSAQEMQSGAWWRHLVAGGVAGAVSRTSTAPFDRIKVYLQVNSHGAHKMSVMRCVRLLYAEGGLDSFWRGNGINVTKIAPETAIKFMVYEQLKREIQRQKGQSDLTTMERFMAGSAAGAISQTAIYPMEVLKTRLALRRTGQMDKGLLHFAHKMYKGEGFWCFYKGYFPNLLGIMPYAGIDLTIYETLKALAMRRSENKEPGIMLMLACGTCSSTLGQLASYPLALVKTRLQAKVSSDVNQPDSMLGQFRYILKTDGVAGLYRGITPNFLKVIPAVSISYVVYEKMRQALGVTMT